MTLKLSPCNTTLLTYNDTCLYGITPLLTYNDTCLYGNTPLLTYNDTCFHVTQQMMVYEVTYGLPVSCTILLYIDF